MTTPAAMAAATVTATAAAGPCGTGNQQRQCRNKAHQSKCSNHHVAISLCSTVCWSSDRRNLARTGKIGFTAPFLGIDHSADRCRHPGYCRETFDAKKEFGPLIAQALSLPTIVARENVQRTSHEDGKRENHAGDSSRE